MTALPAHMRSDARPFIDRARDVPVIWVFIAALVWFAAFAGLRALTSPDEARYLGVVWEMLRSGDWTVPTLDGLPFFHKPPLFYWINATAMSVFGISDWAGRSASILGATAVLTALFAFLKRWSSPQHALHAVLILATLPLFFGAAQFANLDMLVAACIGCTVLLAAHAALSHELGLPYRSAQVGAFVAAALGVLAKGLIGVVLPGAVFVVWSLLALRPRRLWLLLWLPGWLVFAVIAVPWFALVEARRPGFLHYFFITQQFDRFTAGTFNNAQPVWFYIALLALAMLPWLVWCLVAAWRVRRQAAGAVPSPAPLDVRRLLWCWLLVILVFFSIPRSKLVGYMLPVVPPLAALAAGAAWRVFGSLPKAVRALRWTLAGSAFTCVVAIAAAARWLPSPAGGLQAGAVTPGAGERIVMLDGYVYGLPMRWRLRQPVPIWSDWSPARALQSDDWRREMFEAGQFTSAAERERVLIGIPALLALLCAPGPTRVVASIEAPRVHRWLEHAERVAGNAQVGVWRFPGSPTSDPDCLHLSQFASTLPKPP